ncbi:MAG TPA: hypothetical protein VJ649_01100, partial [Actinomycetes bacterium]|nr:hypothetical protein [Actinomycetes bacterium]
MSTRSGNHGTDSIFASNAPERPSLATFASNRKMICTRRDGLDTQSDHDAKHHVAVAADEGDQARKDREQRADHRDRLEEWPQPSTVHGAAAQRDVTMDRGTASLRAVDNAADNKETNEELRFGGKVLHWAEDA